MKKFKAALEGATEQGRRTAIQVARAAVQAQTDALNSAVSDWRTRVEFQQRETVLGNRARFEVLAKGTDETLNVFRFVDEGTKPHIIRPVRASALVFFTPYSARTAPRAQAQAGTGRAGNTKNVRKFVNHPGNDAREFVQVAGETILETIRAQLGK